MNHALRCSVLVAAWIAASCAALSTSVHARCVTGREYELLQPHPAVLPVAPDWLVEIATMSPVAPVPDIPRPAAVGGTRYGVGALKRELGETRDARRTKAAERERLASRLAELRRALEWVDQLAVEWLRVLRELPAGWHQRLAGLDDLPGGGRWPADDAEHESRSAALATWRELAGDAGVESAGLVGLEACQQTLLDALDELNLGERARNRERQAKLVETSERQLAEALDEAAHSRLFSDTERARLAALGGASATALIDLASLHGQLAVQLDEHR